MYSGTFHSWMQKYYITSWSYTCRPTHWFPWFVHKVTNSYMPPFLNLWDCAYMTNREFSVNTSQSSDQLANCDSNKFSDLIFQTVIIFLILVWLITNFQHSVPKFSVSLSFRLSNKLNNYKGWIALKWAIMCWSWSSYLYVCIEDCIILFVFSWHRNKWNENEMKYERGRRWNILHYSLTHHHVKYQDTQYVQYQDTQYVDV